ncbi:MAG TPA: amidohydrolase family protein [Candidatus Sulfopaludibacter sp.]|jgi:imidazolonepropionase-like amidohydrolase/ABC-type multidrug transport system permease subunit|nr:amidohydrolase family protein [Candidatus Sulfopaludibacter sp.]
MRPYIALFKNNLRLTLRDRSALFFNYLFPFIFFFAFAELFHAGTGMGISYFVATVLTMGILGNGLWGAGMRSVQDREANILRRYKVTPITPLPLLLASMASGWLLYLPVLVLLLAAAHFGYAMPMPKNWISLFLMTSLGVCAFRAIGLILGAVTNTMQEANIFVQMLYMPMLFLSGTTIPAAVLPNWAQTLAEFLPATYLVTGFQGIFFRNQTILDNAVPVGALLLTMTVGLFFSVQLFRWEKEEKLAPRKKLWVLAVLAPFLVMGCYRAYSRDHLGENQAMFRDLQRSGTFLIRDARLIIGDGQVIENGAVLVHDGKIVDVFQGSGPDPEKIKADVIEGGGKTLLPGLIDVHVHLSGPAGISSESADYDPDKTMPRAAAALLYSGVTAARSVGDGLDASLALRAKIANGSRLGAQLFVCGPMFTAEGGHGTEFTQHVPEVMRKSVEAQLVRTPKTPEEARRQVRELKNAGVDCIKAILEAGWGDGMLFDRMDLLIARSVAEEAHAQNLPLAVHTGDARDVTDAVEIGAASVEHGSWRDQLPDALIERMVRKGVYLDPTLGVVEAYSHYFSGNSDVLTNSLVQQVVTGRMVKGTRDFLQSGKATDPAKADLFAHGLEQARDNLLRAWKAGVPLVMGTDAGNPLVFHGPSMHRELKLWVDAGIPAAVALQAATGNAARLLHAENRFGSIRKGLDANLLLVDGNPLVDIGATERISLVVFKGERIRRSELFDQK